MSFPKVGRIKLTPTEYKELCQKVLERDGWACRRCNSRVHLQVHHIVKRSFVRIDTSQNLCTLCNECHDLVEGKVFKQRLVILGTDADLSPDQADALKFRLETCE